MTAVQRAAKRRATEILKRFGVTGPPVSAEQIARDLGAQITYETFDGDISGMLLRDQGTLVIGVNSRHAPTRQRFTVAHEVGHILIHEGRPVFIDRFVRVNFRDGESNAEEVEANAFAWLAPDLGEQGAPGGGGDGEYRVCAAGGVAHQDTGRGAADLYTLSTAGAAVSALTPVGADPFHSSSAILAIRSREARTCSASVCIALKRSRTWATMAGSSLGRPSVMSSRFTILTWPGRSAIVKAPDSPACPRMPSIT